MIEKSKSGVSIIGGADGPTSIFIAGKIQKKSLKVKIRNAIYKHKHKRAEKKIVAGAHTLNELVRYAMNKYDLIEINVAERKCIEQRINLRESLILQHKPEVLGEMKDIPKPDISNEESVRQYLDKIKARGEMIAEMSDDIIPMNFHLFKHAVAACPPCVVPAFGTNNARIFVYGLLFISIRVKIQLEISVHYRARRWEWRKTILSRIYICAVTLFQAQTIGTLSPYTYHFRLWHMMPLETLFP